MQQDFIKAFNELIVTRRSIFPDQFEAGATVDDAVIEQILTNATWAPNHGKTEPWHFTVFTGKGLEVLAKHQSQFYKDNAGDNYVESRYQKLLQNPLKASHVIAIQMVRTTTKNIPEIEDIEAVACAVQNLHLSVHAYGLGGYWTTGGITYKPAAWSLLGIEPPNQLLGFFYIGKIATPSTNAKRKPLAEVTQWIR